MSGQKFTPGTPCPDIQISLLAGDARPLSGIATLGDWKLIVFYRGAHCPLCATYIKELDGMLDQFLLSDVEVLAISGDQKEKAAAFAAQHNFSLDIGFGLTTAEMDLLGLYISDPADPRETDRPFCEPGLFVLNAEGLVHIVDISNAPFARPELSKIKQSLDYIRLPEDQRHDYYGARYPIRGTHLVSNF